MGIAHALTQSVTWTTTPDTTNDSEGNWTPGSVTSVSEACLLQPMDTDERYEGTDQIKTRYRLFLLPTTVATARAKGTISGAQYEVDGKPLVYATPRGGSHHVEATVVRIEE